MNKEIEAKFINIDKEVVIAKLIALGATQTFEERFYKRSIFMFPDNKLDTWARVRDEGDKITLTYKRVLSETVDGVEEIELIIDSFEKGRSFLIAMRLIEKAYQESKRIRFELKADKVFFDIDTWPGLKPLIEIEAEDGAKVKEYAQLLGFDWNDAMYGSVDYVYEKVFKVPSGWLFNNCPALTFEKLPKELIQEAK